MKNMLVLFIFFIIPFTSCKIQNNLESQQGKIITSVEAGNIVMNISNNIMVIYQDTKHNYWFGSWQDGLYRFDGKTLVHFSQKHGLPGNRIEEIKEDKYGNIFVNTSNGLCKFNGHVLIEINPVYNYEHHWTLSADDLWFKSYKSQGSVYRYDGENLFLLKLPKVKIGEDYFGLQTNAYSPYDVYTIYNDSKGNVWFGTAALGACRYNGQSFDWILEDDVTEMHNGPSNGIRSIIEDKDGYFWFNSNYRYKVYVDSLVRIDKSNHNQFYLREKSIGNLDGKSDSNLNEYLSIARDDNDGLWIATYRDGVWHYDGKEIRHHNVKVDSKDITLFYIYKDKSGKLWLGTHENGAFRFTGKIFEQFKP